MDQAGFLNQDQNLDSLLNRWSLGKQRGEDSPLSGAELSLLVNAEMISRDVLSQEEKLALSVASMPEEGSEEIKRSEAGDEEIDQRAFEIASKALQKLKASLKQRGLDTSRETFEKVFNQTPEKLASEVYSSVVFEQKQSGGGS